MSEDDSAPVNRRELRLEMKAAVSSLRLLIFLSIVANQTLQHLTIPTEVTVGAFVGVVGAIFGKALLLR